MHCFQTLERYVTLCVIFHIVDKCGCNCTKIVGSFLFPVPVHCAQWVCLLLVQVNYTFFFFYFIKRINTFQNIGHSFLQWHFIKASLWDCDESVSRMVRNLSTDEEFVDELRTSIRFLFSVLLRRARKVGPWDGLLPNSFKLTWARSAQWAFVILQCPASVFRASMRASVNNFFKQHLH